MGIKRKDIDRLEGRLEFTLTEEHLTLLRLMYVGWQHHEAGAPGVDPKRPYGNLNVAADVAAHLGWDMPDEDDMPPQEYDRARAALQARAYVLHMETMLALQVVLVTGEFRPGRYEREDRYDARSWYYAGPVPPPTL